MFAVVLVGGFGTRLRPLTNDVPKPMLPVLHRPMIVHLVERLAAAGVTDVVLALGFKPEPFQSAFPDGRYGDVRVHYAVEPEPLDTAGAIGLAARTAGVDDTFIVANGDIIGATFKIDGTALTDASNVTVKPGDVIAVDHTQGSWTRQFISQVFGFRASFSSTGTLL